MNSRDLASIVNRQVSAAELRDALERPIDEQEREEILSLVRWFTRRYASPAERLAYVRRAYARWSRRAPAP